MTENAVDPREFDAVRRLAVALGRRVEVGMTELDEALAAVEAARGEGQVGRGNPASVVSCAPTADPSPAPSADHELRVCTEARDTMPGTRTDGPHPMTPTAPPAVEPLAEVVARVEQWLAAKKAGVDDPPQDYMINGDRLFLADIRRLLAVAKAVEDEDFLAREMEKCGVGYDLAHTIASRLRAAVRGEAP